MCIYATAVCLHLRCHMMTTVPAREKRQHFSRRCRDFFPWFFIVSHRQSTGPSIKKSRWYSRINFLHERVRRSLSNASLWPEAILHVASWGTSAPSIVQRELSAHYFGDLFESTPFVHVTIRFSLSLRVVVKGIFQPSHHRCCATSRRWIGFHLLIFRKIRTPGWQKNLNHSRESS